ncbi:MAG: asparagine synthase C-terminal domain-containing protein, partial [Flavobacteriaceae bacterium]
SRIIGTKHNETICKPEDLLSLLPKLFEAYGEPFADSSSIPSLLLNKTTKPQVTVVLSGDGGDESFFGYNHFEWSKIFDYFFSIPYFLRKTLAFLIPYKILGKRALAVKNIFKFKTFDNFIESVFIGFSSFLIKRDNTWLKHFDSFRSLSKDKLQKLADLNIKLWLENDSNVKVDRASMAYSVEVRSPFLDYRIIEFARTLPISYRIYGKKRKRILKDILKEYIPETVFETPKMGFGIPLKTWIRNELKDEFIENLNDENLNKIENLNVELIKEYFKKHLSEKEDYSSYLWRVYVLIKWMKLNGESK